MANHSSEESFSSDLMTRRGVERVFQLSSEPPAMAALNDYILAAKPAITISSLTSFTTMNVSSTAEFTLFCKATVLTNTTQNVFLI